MSASNRLSGAKGKIFFLLLFVLFASIGAHAAQYLMDTPKLFFVVFLARLLAALGIALGIAVLWTILAKLFKYRETAYGFWTVFAGSGAIVSVVMMLVSINNKVSEGLLLLYS